MCFARFFNCRLIFFLVSKLIGASRSLMSFILLRVVSGVALAMTAAMRFRGASLS